MLKKIVLVIIVLSTTSKFRNIQNEFQYNLVKDICMK